MNDKQLDRRIEHAFEQITPDVLDSILSDCREQKGNMMVISNVKRKIPLSRRLAAAAAALVLLVGTAAGIHGYSIAHTPVSVVSLDVNPSLEMKLNRNDKVIELIPKNPEAEAIIGDMDYSGSSVELSLNSLVDSLLRNGYLSPEANSILVSVDSTKPQTAQAMQEKLDNDLNKIFAEEGFEGSVMSQRITEGEQLDSLCENYDISQGKAQLIKDMSQQLPQFSLAELAQLSINDLNLILSNAKLDMPQLNISGAELSHEKYLDSENALKQALQDAGLDISQIANVSTNMDISDGVLVYDFEFQADEYQYRYQLQADSGAIVKRAKELAQALEDFAEEYADDWESWAESHGDQWELWAEQYAGDWERWAKDYGREIENWAESYASNFESWADSLESWAERYFDF